LIIANGISSKFYALFSGIYLNLEGDFFQEIEFWVDFLVILTTTRPVISSTNSKMKKIVRSSW